MNTLNKIAIAGLALVMGPALYADAPDPNQVSIDSIDYSGNGCPFGSVVTNISDDAQAMTVLFDDFVVATDDAPNQSTIKKSCNLDVNLRVPAGWSYGLFCVDFRGYAGLDENISGTQTASYKFNGRRPLQVGKMNLQGFYDDDYEHLTAIPLNTVSWSPCGTGDIETLQLATEIAVKKPQPRAYDRGRVMRAANLTHAFGNNLYHRIRHKMGRNSDAANLAGQMKNAANAVRDAVARRKPFQQQANKFQTLLPLGESVLALIDSTPRLKNDRPIGRVFQPRFKEQFEELQSYLVSPGADAQGLLTVDSVDGELKHHYGITWRRCGGGGGGQCQNLPPQKTFGDGHAHTLVRLMQEKLNAEGAPQQMIPREPLRRTTGGSGGGFRWNANSGTVDQLTLDNFCNVMGYKRAVSSQCLDAERSGRYPNGKCNFHSPGNNSFNYFDGNAYQTLRGPDKYRTTWATKITCAEPINPCD